MKQIGDKWVYDSIKEILEPSHTAVVVVDVQNDFCHDNGHFARYGKALTEVKKCVPTIVDFVNGSQELGLRHIFVRQATQPLGKSDSPAWLRFKTRDGKSPEYTLPDTWGWQFVDGLNVRPQDLVVEKYRPDAFVYTNLDQLLKANGVETVVIVGVTTEGCVESTVRGASYHDYYTVVVEDGVASPNQVLHEGSMRLMKARYPVHTSTDILSIWHDYKDKGGSVSA